MSKYKAEGYILTEADKLELIEGFKAEIGQAFDKAFIYDLDTNLGNGEIEADEYETAF